MNKITVIGLGYVGLATTLLLAKQNTVIGIDIDKRKLDLLKNRICPIKEKELQDQLYITSADFSDDLTLCKDSKYIFIALPTNFDKAVNKFDTSIIESVVEKISELNKDAIIIIKSTIPVGFIDYLSQKFSNLNIVFMPEFLREGSSWVDSLYPSRVIVGTYNDNIGKDLLVLYSKVSIFTEKYIMSPSEAEAVKLFANTYLAMRVAYFNELDSFAVKNGLNSLNIINGVCSDNRIGKQYNNPSFGYGGYCLPKDTKQLLSNFIGSATPQSLISAIVDSNYVRKQFIANYVKSHGKTPIGVYKLAMKSGSDNYRESAILDIIKLLSDKNCIIYDDSISDTEFLGYKVYKSLDEFCFNCNTIITNRVDDTIKKCADKFDIEIITCDRVGGN